MKLNDNLKRIFNLRTKYSEYANSIIENFWASQPEINESLFDGISNNHTISIETIGHYNGQIGTWETSMNIDQNREISKLKLSFRTDISSKTPHADTYTLSLSGITPATPFWNTTHTLIDFTQSRVYNYRMLEVDHPLTAAEIKKLSQPVTLAKFILTAKKDQKDNKYSTFASESIGFGFRSGNGERINDSYSGYMSSETPEEIEA